MTSAVRSEPARARLLIGGYTAEMGGGATGISVLDVRSYPSGEVEVERVAVQPAISPSYLLAHPSEPWIFATGESQPGRVSSYRLEDDGQLTELSNVPAGGDVTCHLALAPDRRHLVAANYGSGSVTSFAVTAGGLLSEQRDVVAFAGSGPDRERQDAPHAHQALWVGSEIYVCDLGTDAIHRLTIDPQGRFAAEEPIRLPSGVGPRHCVVVDDLLLVACELSAELWVGRRADGGWVEAQRLPTSKAGAAPAVSPSGIVATGRRIFVANRGPGTVSAFEVVRGTVRKLVEFDCGGTVPRDLTLARGRLLVANQEDDVVTVLPIEKLPPTEELEIAAPTPTCVVVLIEAR